MKKLSLLILLFLLVGVRLVSAHAVGPKPIYYPDKEYKDQGWKVPRLPGKAIAILDGKKIGKEDYIDWLVIRADKDYLFDKFITEKLIERKARELGIKVSAKDIERRANDRVESYIARLKVNEKEFKDNLAQSGLKEVDFKRLHKAKVSKEIEKYLVPSLIIFKEWDIPEASIKRIFNDKYGKGGRKYKLKQLFFAIERKHLKRGEEGYARAVSAIEEKARKSLEEVLAMIKAGADFAMMAEEYSDDKDSGYQGGYLGKYVKGMNGLEFDEVVPILEKGQVSDVIKSKKGFHIVKIVDKQGEDIVISHIHKSVNYYSVVDMDVWEREKARLTKEIEGLTAGLKTAEGFRVMAEKESEDYAGAYGVVNVDDWNNPWDLILGDGLQGLGKGDISGIIETEKGLHVVLVEDLKITEYNKDVYDKLKKEIAFEIALKQYNEFTAKLREEAEVIKHLVK